MKRFFLILISIHFFPLHRNLSFSSIFLSVPALLNFSQTCSTIFAFSSFSLSVPYSFRSSVSHLSLLSSYFTAPPSLLVTKPDRGKQTVLIQFGNEVY